VPHFKTVVGGKPISAGDTAAGRGPESGKTDALEAVFAVNQGAQPVLNAMRKWHIERNKPAP
jgi:hypothetical protein